MDTKGKCLCASYSRFLVDALTAEPQIRHSLTFRFSDVSHLVYTSDSPSPFTLDTQLVPTAACSASTDFNQFPNPRPQTPGASVNQKAAVVKA